ncbi:Innexin [Meloidogyne graminicola]|uniref:Innexin n=1 Tax=Meloidogyne graminicola TaxID=189291 RepID=A0A8T0A252_9BILA|nr:Innexin [Meloidogyne graminicola]
MNVFPMRPIERENREIHYYQWVPFILVGQALLMMLPKLLWNAFNWKTGLDTRSLIQLANKLAESGDYESKDTASKEIGTRFGIALTQAQRRQMKQTGGGQVSTIPAYPESLDGPWATNSFVTFCYLTLKMLNICSIFLQLYILTCFLGNTKEADSEHFWGVAVLKDLLEGRDWHKSGAFPRVTYCDFEIRQAAREMRPLKFSLQCVLMFIFSSLINMINEKIFLFLWFWLIALAAVGVFNLIYWLYHAFYLTSADRFVRCQLRLSVAKMPNDKEIRHFVRKYLSYDGITILRLIALNCDPTVCSLLVLFFRRNNEILNNAGIKTNNPNFLSTDKKKF